MALFWNLIIFFLVPMAISLGIGYGIAQNTIGAEVARRNLRYALPWLLLGFAITFAIPFIGEYAWVSLSILFTVGSILWLLSWFFRKQEAGVMLLDVGRNAQNKFLLWFSSLGVTGAIWMTWSFFEELSRGYSESGNLAMEALRLAFFWSLPIFFMALGLSKLELRENGICFMFSFISWQRIKSYNWEQSKPNTLTIRFKPRYPLFPGFMSIIIPAKHRDAVNHILNERVSDNNLQMT